MGCGWPNYKGEEVSGGQGSGLASREWCGFWGIIKREEDLCGEGMILCSDSGGGCKSSYLWLNNTELCTQCVLSPDFSVPEITQRGAISGKRAELLQGPLCMMFWWVFQNKKRIKGKMHCLWVDSDVVDLDLGLQISFHWAYVYLPPHKHTEKIFNDLIVRPPSPPLPPPPLPPRLSPSSPSNRLRANNTNTAINNRIPEKKKRKKEFTVLSVFREYLAWE